VLCFRPADVFDCEDGKDSAIAMPITQIPYTRSEIVHMQ
jgi:hypothetical protein